MKITKKVVVLSAKGLNVKASIQLHNLAKEFGCEVSVRKGLLVANAKSLLSLLALASPEGTEIEITVNGSDSKTAMFVILNFFHEKFGQETGI